MIVEVLRRLASDVGLMVADALADEAGWTTGGGYYLRHAERGIEIWIANKAYGLRLSVEPPAKSGFPPPPPSGVAFRPSFVDRHLIWQAVKRLGVKSPRQYERAQILKALRTGDA